MFVATVYRMFIVYMSVVHRFIHDACGHHGSRHSVALPTTWKKTQLLPSLRERVVATDVVVSLARVKLSRAILGFPRGIRPTKW